MDVKEIDRLKFRRQYLLIPAEIECPFDHIRIEVSSTYYLYYHPDLKVTTYTEGDLTIILLGDLFDCVDPSMNNLEIIQDLADCEFNSVMERSERCAGRFVMIHNRAGSLKIFHDATASRKIFYTTDMGNLWISSQSHLLAKVLRVRPTRDVSKLDYYNSDDFVRMFGSNICNSTYYDEIFQLMPNHYLDITLHEINRYWPNRPLEIRPLNETAELCATMVKGFVESIAARYKVMLPITAGKDSRTLLAASTGFKNELYYYVNKELRLNENSPDIKIPKKLLSDLNLNFHVLNPYNHIDEDFIKVFYENNPFGSKRFLPLIFNYYKNFGDKVNMPANNTAGGAEYFFEFVGVGITIENLLMQAGLKKYTFIKDLYEKWLDTNKDICYRYNMPLLNLFYWENRLTNVILQIQMDKDIAQEEFSPYNSRKLASALLNVELKYILPPDYLLFKKMMEILWPEVLREPVNPSVRTNLFRMLGKIGLLNASLNIKNKLAYRKNTRYYFK